MYSMHTDLIAFVLLNNLISLIVSNRRGKCCFSLQDLEVVRVQHKMSVGVCLPPIRMTPALVLLDQYVCSTFLPHFHFLPLSSRSLSPEIHQVSVHYVMQSSYIMYLPFSGRKIIFFTCLTA